MFGSTEIEISYEQHFTLVLGGIASGKSVYAEGLVATDRERVYIATAQAFDDEMRIKIAEHQKQRGPNWITREAPTNLPEVLGSSREPACLVDCATFWLSNLLLNETPLDPEFDALMTAIKNKSGKLVIVSNEVGHAPVATTQLGRRFQNAQGRLNQRLAKIADSAVFVTAGIARVLK